MLKNNKAEWKTDYGVLVLKKLPNGNLVGSYLEDENGKMLLKPVGEQVYQGTWVEDSSDQKCEVPHEDGRLYWGQLTFLFDESNFEGIWGCCDDDQDKAWNGQLIEKEL